MMIARRMRGFGSLGWSMAVGLLLPVLISPGCGRRAYPARDPVSFAQTDGAVEVGVAFNQCPDLTLGVSPADGPASQPFTVEGATSDPDGTPVTLSLHATSGRFSISDQLPSIFTCGTPGLIEITAIASDGLCQTMKSVSIFCLGTHANDGGGDGSGPPGPADGGAGNTDGSVHGDAGGPMVVTNTCPNEPPSGGSDCAECTINNCSLAPSPDGTDGCCAQSSVADQLLCLAAAECFAGKKCTVAGGDPARCYCGTSGSDCFVVPGAANGACVAETVAAAKKSDPSTIRSLWISSASPLGRAVNLLGCRGSFCPAECGVQ